MAIEMLPSFPSMMEWMESEERPRLTEYDVNTPSYNLLMPLLIVPAQTDPSRVRSTE